MSITIVLLLLVGLAVAMGAFSQTITGFGFSLLVVPACVLALPSPLVVGTVARLAVVVDAWVLAGTYRQLDRSTAARLVLSGLCAVPVGLALVHLVPLRMVVLAGSAATLAAAGALAARRSPPPGRRRSAAAGPGPRPGRRHEGATTAAVGFTAGVLGLTSGLCGPPVALHSLSTRRPLSTSRGTMAVFFLVVDLVAVVLHPHAVGVTPLLLFVAAGAAGIRLGGRARARVADATVATAVLGLVVACSLGAMIRSLW